MLKDGTLWRRTAKMYVMRYKPEPQPEGKLISYARMIAGLSVREAARRAGISEARWRQIANGYQVTRGEYFPEVGSPAGTVARMARGVYVTPEALEEAGRADAAGELRNLNHSSEATNHPSDDLDQRIARLKGDTRKRRKLEQAVDLIEDCN
jgi:transcriptional regulator with XRE-family HTH domain